MAERRADAESGRHPSRRNSLRNTRMPSTGRSRVYRVGSHKLVTTSDGNPQVAACVDLVFAPRFGLFPRGPRRKVECAGGVIGSAVTARTRRVERGVPSDGGAGRFADDDGGEVWCSSRWCGAFSFATLYTLGLFRRPPASTTLWIT